MHYSQKAFYSRGGGGTSLYNLFRYMPPQRVWFLSRCGLKMDIDYDHFGLNSGMVFKGSTKSPVQRYLSFPLQMNNREREVTKIYHLS